MLAARRVCVLAGLGGGAARAAKRVSSTGAKARHERTLARVFGGTAGAVGWRDVERLVQALGGDTRRDGLALEADLRGRKERFTLAPGRHRDHKALASARELHQLRTFLAAAGVLPEDVSVVPAHLRAAAAAAAARHEAVAAAAAAAEGPEEGPLAVVVADHHEARVTRFALVDDVGGLVDPEREKVSSARHTVHVYDPLGKRRHLRHKRGPSSGPRSGPGPFAGDYIPEPADFYHKIEERLVGATHVLIVSHAKGKANAGQQLLRHAKAHSPEVAKRVTAVLSLDTTHMTDNELLAHARAHFAKVLRTRRKRVP